jgi:hypothetical protein
MSCDLQAGGTIERYFYGELPPAERAGVQAHVAQCAECRAALDDLSVIRAALAVTPDVATPPGGDWSGFMTRLDARIAAEAAPGTVVAPAKVVEISWRRRVAPYLAAAAVLALVTIAAIVTLRQPGTDAPADAGETAGEAIVRSEPAAAPVLHAVDASTGADAALSAVSSQHFERSKLVVLGLATKDAQQADWEYERELAGSLLNDTRLYRLAAEERGMQSLAGVMRDLELVLLQTSMSEQRDAASLEHLQRLIRRRDLITKMEIVHAGGGM